MIVHTTVEDQVQAPTPYRVTELWSDGQPVNYVNEPQRQDNIAWLNVLCYSLLWRKLKTLRNSVDVSLAKWVIQLILEPSTSIKNAHSP